MPDQPELKTPADRLKWLITFSRTDDGKKVSQSALADALRVSPAYVCYMVKGTRPIKPDRAAGIGEFFGVNPNWLMCGQGPMTAATGDGSRSLGTLPSDDPVEGDYREKSLIYLFRSVPDHKRWEMLKVISVMATYSDSIQEGAQA